MKTKKSSSFGLDADEKELLASFERGEWQRVKNFKEETEAAKLAAKQHLKKDARINIRLPTSDLEHLKQIAAHEGLPYQTLISSVLHKYAAHYANLPR